MGIVAWTPSGPVVTSPGGGGPWSVSDLSFDPATQAELNADDATDAHLAGNQTFTGNVTFSGQVKLVNGIPWADLRGFSGADPTGAASSQTALNAAESALSAVGGGVLYFGPGTWAFSDASWSPKSGVTYRGAGPTATTVVQLAASAAAVIFTGNSNWIIEEMSIQVQSPAQGVAVACYDSRNFVIRSVNFLQQSSFSINLNDCRDGRIVGCNFAGRADSNGPGTAIQFTRCRNIYIGANRFRNFAAGIIGAGGGASSYEEDVSANIEVAGNDFDGRWINQPALTSGSGGTVTYSATVLTDSGASFSALTANSTIRSMPVRATGTATTLTRLKVTDSGANFTSSGVRKGDMIVTGTVYGLVAAVESSTVLTVEEWLIKATNVNTDTPAAAAYTIYRLLFGSMTSFTGTTVTVARWMDLDGNAVTPASGTRYEVCYGPTSHPMYFEAGCRYVKAIGNTCRRGWGDQIRFLGNYCQAIGNLVEDGFDVGIESEGGSHCIISDNIVRGQGVWGILTGNDTVVTGNHISDTPWLNPNNGVPIAVGGSRADVSHNKIIAGRSVLCRFGILAYSAGAALADNTLRDNTFKGMLTVSGNAPAMVGFNSVSGGTIAHTHLDGNTNPDGVALWAEMAGSSGVTDVVAPSGTGTLRPAAGVAAAFGQTTYYNTTTGKPNFTTGSAWVLADGTAA